MLLPIKDKLMPLVIYEGSLCLILSISFGILSSTFSLISSTVDLEVREKSYIPYVIACTTTLIGGFTWLRACLMMNRADIGNKRYLAYGLVFYMFASFCWLSTAFATIRKDWSLQFATSLLASCNSWTAFVIMYNKSFSFPTRQQMVSMSQILLLAGLWELRNYFVSIVLVDE